MIKKYFPGTWQWLADFFAAMNTRRTGHSLTKWLAVGFFGLAVKVTLWHTDKENLVSVLTILTGTIVTLAVTKAVSTHQEMKLTKDVTPTPDNNIPA